MTIAIPVVSDIAGTVAVTVTLWNVNTDGSSTCRKQLFQKQCGGITRGLEYIKYIRKEVNI